MVISGLDLASPRWKITPSTTQPGDGKYTWRKVRTVTSLSAASLRSWITAVCVNGHQWIIPNATAPKMAHNTPTITTSLREARSGDLFSDPILSSEGVETADIGRFEC